MAIPQIESFIVNLTKTNSQESIRLLCENELSYLRLAYNVQNEVNEDGIYSGLATYKRAITEYRKAIYELDRKHNAFDYFKLSEFDARNLKQQNARSTMRNYVNRMNNNIFTIQNPIEYIKTSIELLTADSYINNILGLAALTGRRVNEIGYASEFDVCDYDDMYEAYYLFEQLMDLEVLDFIAVFGLSKKQTYLEDKNVSDSGIIPILCNKELVFNAMIELRQNKTFTCLNDFHNKTSKELSKKVKKLYGEFLGNNCIAHDLRKVYARLCYDLMINPNVKNDDGLLAFTATCLLQSVPDNYMKFISTKPLDSRNVPC